VQQSAPQCSCDSEKRELRLRPINTIAAVVQHTALQDANLLMCLWVCCCMCLCICTALQQQSLKIMCTVARMQACSAAGRHEQLYLYFLLVAVACTMYVHAAQQHAGCSQHTHVHCSGPSLLSCPLTATRSRQHTAGRTSAL
jgi:hypothetical protein